MLFKFIHEINSGTPVHRSTVLVEGWHYTGQTARDSGSYYSWIAMREIGSFFKELRRHRNVSLDSGKEKGGWCCQTNANQYQFPANLNLLGCTDGTPLDQSSGTVQLEI